MDNNDFINSVVMNSQFYSMHFQIEESIDLDYNLGISVIDSIGSIVFQSIVTGKYAYRLYDILCYIEQLDDAYYASENNNSNVINIAVFPKPMVFQNNLIQVCVAKDISNGETYFSIGMQNIVNGVFNVIKIPYDMSTKEYSNLISLLYVNFILRVFSYGTRPSYYFDHIEEFIEKEH